MAGQSDSDGDGSVVISGESKMWHTVTLSLNGPFARERDSAPNPFRDIRFDVRVTHESGEPSLLVPGYFAADGDAGNTSADAGNIWRAHFVPSKSGSWTYEVSLRRGPDAALDRSVAGKSIAPGDGARGEFTIAASDKQRPDFRAEGLLEYVGERYLRFAGSGRAFLKAGPDSPETLLAYADFDGTTADSAKSPLKRYAAHERDWQSGDPEWRNGKGRGLIGAISYLSAAGANSISFLPYNAGGDGDNVWPFVTRDDKFHYDCSKLDQWGIVFKHATRRGVFLHFKLQETEMDDNRRKKGDSRKVPTSLDGGKLGPERKLYLRELAARFGHNLALNWNIGEENTQSVEEVQAMIDYLREVDPYDHPIVMHTFPNEQDKKYQPFVGNASGLNGVSLQNDWSAAHERVTKWVTASDKSGHAWVVCNDEQGPASLGVPPDEGYKGHSGAAEDKKRRYTRHDIRRQTLWGTLLAGGAGVEYYFGYKLPENDLKLEDFRSRDAVWSDCAHALRFFEKYNIPVGRMRGADGLARTGGSGDYVFCEAGQLYLVFRPRDTSLGVDLSDVRGRFGVMWYDTRSGGELQSGSVQVVTGGGVVDLGRPPSDLAEDWLAVVRRINE